MYNIFQLGRDYPFSQDLSLRLSLSKLISPLMHFGLMAADFDHKYNKKGD